MVLAQDGDMGNDVHGGYVCREHDDTMGKGGIICSAAGGFGCEGRDSGGGFAKGFDDFFDAAFEGFVFRGCVVEKHCLATNDHM